jgi:hypothetical protein
MKGGALRKPPQRAPARRHAEHLTTNEIMAWLDARLAKDPKLRRSIKRVLAALRRAEAPAGAGASATRSMTTLGVPVTALRE